MSSLDPILRPRSIAVIGASRRPNGIGWQIIDNLLAHGFQGPVYPVHPSAPAIHSIRAYPTITDIPETVDLAVVAVPAAAVLEVVRQCVEAGTQGLVIISAGFKEIGGEGEGRERELLDLLRDHDVRMVGPNCMGVINTNPQTRLNATFAPNMPPAGPVGFVSQSGAMGLSILDYAESLGIGMSMFVSVGNKADVSGNDLLEYWRDDEQTKLVLMYLESFGNPRRFVDLARAFTRERPICVVKSGRTGAGARAAASHTGALAQTELATDALLAQAGAIRAETVGDLFDLAMALSNQPLPRGNRVAVVTNAGGPGIIIADSCETNGLDVTALSSDTEAKLRAQLPQEASVRNPVDLIASATAQSYEFALATVLADEHVDAAIAAFVPPLGIQTQDVAEAIVRVNALHRDKPLLAVLMGRQGLPAGIAELHEANVPAYVFPESAARALGAMWRYAQQRQQPVGQAKSFDTDDAAVTKILDRAMEEQRKTLSEPDAIRVLEAYGIPVVPWRFVSHDGNTSLPTAVAEAAGDLGFPVALKVVSPQIIHKTDVGGVMLGRTSKEDVRRGMRELLKRVSEVEVDGESPQIDGILVQQMAPSGRETIVGLTRIPSIGPMVMFGLGGVYVEVLRDVVLRLCPLLDTDADAMIREVKLYKLLEGIRGEPPRDRAALAEAILRIGQLAERHERITEMDINPLLSFENGMMAIDARVGLE
jgi:acetyltransferase